MITLKFQTPPPSTAPDKGQSKYDDVMAELAKHPGEWAIVIENDSPGASGYLKKKYGVEVTTRRNPTSKNGYDTYARYPAKATVPVAKIAPPARNTDKRGTGMVTVNGSEEFFTIPQLAAFLETNTTELHKLNYTGRGPRFYRVSDEIRYRPADVGEWLAKNAYRPMGGSPRTPEAA